MKKVILKNIWWIILLISLILLISHSFSFETIKVDNTSIILLIIILISPFITAIKKIKYGEFEAEIETKEVQKLKDIIENKIPIKEQITKEIPDIQQTSENIKELVSSDPVIALAKLRIELEKILKRFYKITLKDKKIKHPLSIWKMVADLSNNEIISQNILGPIREVVSICNRAIHGEDIKQRDAQSIIDSGISLFEMLQLKMQDYILETSEKIIISKKDEEFYAVAKYKLTTVIPLVENPVKNIRYVDQEALDDFLEGYNNYAEYIVEIIKI